jgi:NAD-dependent deacetylase
MSDTLREIIEGSNNIVFFGGAGVSTESGIPDFRSADGLYQAKLKYGRSPENLISHSAIASEPETFFDYYKHNLVWPDAKPNDAHRALAKLEAEGRVKAVVTQNVDGLHQLAGSNKVYELHGSVHRNYCLTCYATYDLAYILDDWNCIGKDGKQSNIPRCAKCGGTVRPDVVLYEESLNEQVVRQAVEAISKAGVLIVGGTSLVVYPAASYLGYFRGEKLVLINKSETAMDNQANLVIRRPIGEVLADFLNPNY